MTTGNVRRLMAVLLVRTLCLTLPVQAERLTLPLPGNDLIGEIRHVRALSSDTLIDIARENDIGYREIVQANQTLNRWVPRPGASVIVPSRYILPAGSRKGIVFNVAELRLYYFPSGHLSAYVYTFPVSVGRMDWRTPLGITKIAAKVRDPAWRPPKSIREEYAEEGEELPLLIPGGDPENPLGRYALRLALPSYLIHGTDEAKSFGIGMRVTHGCIRLYPEDMEELYGMVPVGTPVHILDQPIKVGWEDEQLYLQVSHPLKEEDDNESEIGLSFGAVMEQLAKSPETKHAYIHEDAVEEALQRRDGIPALIGAREESGDRRVHEGTTHDSFPAMNHFRIER